MVIIQRNSPLWSYFSETQRDLILEGDYLLNDVIREHKTKFKDYSFLVFPFAKAYEGFLKQLFLDVGFISHLDYISDHYRLGKFLSPHLMERLGDRSLYRQIVKVAGHSLAEEIWQMWKLGRNQIMHYYPHNIKKVTLEESERVTTAFMRTMDHAYRDLYREKSRDNYIQA